MIEASNSTNHAAFSRAREVISSGVNSPVRAFQNVGGDPLFIANAEGDRIQDIEGNSYIDFVGSWGPMIAGHAHPKVIAAVTAQLKYGLGYGTPTLLETEMAKNLIRHLPSMDKVRLMSSGTEATMTAIRIARGYTRRDKIIKFNGCYHGHSDGLLVKAGSGAMTHGVATSAGVPEGFARDCLSVEFNDLSIVKNLLQKVGSEVAAIIIEPIAGNMNCIPPIFGYLQGLRALCDEYGCLLIFDEIMTGFRVDLGGAQRIYGIDPDLTTLGKIIGGGLPVSAVGGKDEYMAVLSPQGPVYQAGTLSGNPIALSAGLATLKLLEEPDFYSQLSAKSKYLMEGIANNAKHYDIPLQTTAVGGMFGLFFTTKPVIKNSTDASSCDLAQFRHFFQAMLAQGIYFAPSAFEAGFMSQAHSYDSLDATIEAAAEAFRTMP